ncbi:MAG: right-handed parallel beta-helix repeat-containing protein, partial [Flavobacteriales bacterium]
MYKILFSSLLLLSFSSFSQTNYYISQQTGSDSNDGLSPTTPFKTIKKYTKPSNGLMTPGDSVFLIGQFTNTSYDTSYSFSAINDAHLWHGENTISLNNINGNAANYITFLPYDSSTILHGDGGNIFRVQNSSYLNIIGFEIEGEVIRIPLSTAFSVQFVYLDATTVDPKNPTLSEVLYRVQPGTSKAVIAATTFPLLGSVNRPSYTDTRGMYLSNVHHINIKNNNIHHMPGGGLRISECEYIWIRENEIHYNSLRSFSGTHGLVVTKAKSTDTTSGYKIWIERNKVHHNYNEVYSWAPTKTIITPHLDEGKGISMQRNQASNGWLHGRILIANNLCYWNGFSGVHSNDGDRMDFINNTCYMNSYTGTVTDTSENANNIGISSSDGDGMRMINNIIVVDNSVGGFALSSKGNTGLVVKDNLIFGMNGGTLRTDPDVTSVEINTQISDPKFINPSAFNFGLQNSSPAIGNADVSFAPTLDLFGNTRDSS